MSSSMANMNKALVVDEDLICLRIASKLFENFNFKVVPFQSAAEALYFLKGSKDEEFDLALIEVHVGSTGFASLTGFELLDHIHKEKNIPVFTMCAHKEDDILLVQCLQDKGSSYHISKPLTMERIEILHQKILAKRGKRSAAEASGHNILPSNEKYETIKTASKIVHIVSDDEDFGSGDQRGKRVRWDCELLNKNLGGIEAPRESPTPQNIIMNIVVQGPANDQAPSYLQKKEDQQSVSKQSPFSHFKRNLHFHYHDVIETAVAPPPATLKSGPSLSELLDVRNTTAPRQVHSYPVYTNVGIVLQSSDNSLWGLNWQNVCQSRGLRFGEFSGDLAAPNFNNLDSREELALPENPIPDAPFGDAFGVDVAGCSGKEPEVAAGTDLPEEIEEDFDIGELLFDENFMDSLFS